MADAATVSALVRDATARLAASGAGSPRLDAELLLAHVLRIDRTGVIAHPDAPVGPGAQAQYEADVARRETELLVDAALAEVSARLTAAPRPAGTPALRVADVGTGSGAIALALLA